MFDPGTLNRASKNQYYTGLIEKHFRNNILKNFTSGYENFNKYIILKEVNI